MPGGESCPPTDSDRAWRQDCGSTDVIPGVGGEPRAARAVDAEVGGEGRNEVKTDLPSHIGAQGRDHEGRQYIVRVFEAQTAVVGTRDDERRDQREGPLEGFEDRDDGGPDLSGRGIKEQPLVGGVSGGEGGDLIPCTRGGRSASFSLSPVPLLRVDY